MTGSMLEYPNAKDRFAVAQIALYIFATFQVVVARMRQGPTNENS